jgi:hypothetical protein
VGARRKSERANKRLHMVDIISIIATTVFAQLSAPST